MRVSNPSNAEMALFNTDSYSTVREFCTCPGCKAVWTHMETGNIVADEKWARATYKGETQCMECGLITEAIPRPSLWQSLRGFYRRTVDAPMPMAAKTRGYEEER
jgi:hypothetical protein